MPVAMAFSTCWGNAEENVAWARVDGMASGVPVGLAGFPVCEQRHMRWAGSIFVKASLLMGLLDDNDALEIQ